MIEKGQLILRPSVPVFVQATNNGLREVELKKKKKKNSVFLFWLHKNSEELHFLRVLPSRK